MCPQWALFSLLFFLLQAFNLLSFFICVLRRVQFFSSHVFDVLHKMQNSWSLLVAFFTLTMFNVDMYCSCLSVCTCTLPQLVRRHLTQCKDSSHYMRILAVLTPSLSMCGHKSQWLVHLCDPNNSTIPLQVAAPCAVYFDLNKTGESVVYNWRAIQREGL